MTAVVISQRDIVPESEYSMKRSFDVLNPFSRLSAVLGLLLLVAGCAHWPDGNRVAVPNRNFHSSFSHAPYISPRIVQDLSSWVSDHGDQIVAINLLESQESNRYFGDVQIRKMDSENQLVFVRTTTFEYGETNHSEFGYRCVGVTRSGVYVLKTVDWGGGSGVFVNLLLLTFEYDQGISCDWGKGVVRPDRKRLLVRKRGEIGLGDRWDGELRVKGNSIFVGEDNGWFTVSGGTGGGPLSYDSKDRVLKLEIDH